MNSLSMDEILQARLKELEMSPYQIAQAIAGDDGNPKAYTNRVGNTLTDPKNRKFCSVEEVVKILGGRIVIQWTDVKEQVVS